MTATFYGVLAGCLMALSWRAAKRAPIALRDVALTVHWTAFALLVTLHYVAWQIGQ